MSGLLAILIGGGAISLGMLFGWQVYKLRNGNNTEGRALGMLLLALMVACSGVLSFMSASNTSDYDAKRFASMPTQIFTEWYDLILNQTQEFTFETAMRVGMRYNGEQGQTVNIRVLASNESKPMIGIIISDEDGKPKLVQNLSSPNPNIICEYTFPDNNRHSFFFEAQPAITYTVNFESDSICADQ